MQPRTPVTIRPLQPEDIYAVADLHTRAISQVCAKAYSPEAIEAWNLGRRPEKYLVNQQRGETFLVAINTSGTPVGFTGFMNGELCGLYIDPDYHGQYIGTQLIQTAQTAAQASGHPITWLHSTLNAESFYQSHGFHTISHGYVNLNGVNIAQIRMEK